MHRRENSALAPRATLAATVLRRFCASAFHAATVPALAPWRTLEGLARLAVSRASMAGAGGPAGIQERRQVADIARLPVAVVGIPPDAQARLGGVRTARSSNAARMCEY